MPPHRRRPSPTSGPKPPVRRPKKVAGRHNSGHTGEIPVVRPDKEEPAEDAVAGVLDGVLGSPPPTTEDRPSPSTTDGKHARTDDKRTESRSTSAARERTATRSKSAAERATRSTDKDTDGKREERRPSPKPKPAEGTRRPAGKRRSTGSSRPENLEAAETGAGAEKPRRATTAAPRSRASRQISLAIALAVAAVVLGGLAVFFRGQADGLNSGDTNTAMTDMGATTQVKSQLTDAINKTFSYNYTDLDSTAKAVQERLSDKALCEYNMLFGEVKKLAPQQKIILNTEVRDLGVVRIDGDRAEALVYIDQVSTRVDLNKSVSVRGQFAVQAKKTGDDWKITKFDMFGQPLFNGKPAPNC